MISFILAAALAYITGYHLGRAGLTIPQLLRGVGRALLVPFLGALLLVPALWASEEADLAFAAREVSVCQAQVQRLKADLWAAETILKGRAESFDKLYAAKASRKAEANRVRARFVAMEKFLIAQVGAQTSRTQIPNHPWLEAAGRKVNSLFRR